MSTNLADILTSLQQGVLAINKLNATLQTIFPQATATSTTAATAGTISFTSSEAAIFISVTTSSGGTYKIAGYT